MDKKNLVAVGDLWVSPDEVVSVRRVYHHDNSKGPVGTQIGLFNGTYEYVDVPAEEVTTRLKGGTTVDLRTLEERIRIVSGNVGQVSHRVNGLEDRLEKLEPQKRKTTSILLELLSKPEIQKILAEEGKRIDYDALADCVALYHDTKETNA